MVTDYNLKENGNCKIYTYQTNPNLYNAVVSLVESLNTAPLHQVFVGISGINNTGKTSIINKCKEILDDNFTVRVIPDIFVGKDIKGDYSRENRQILLRQGEDLCEKYTEQIIIFDRTPFDNFFPRDVRTFRIGDTYEEDIEKVAIELAAEIRHYYYTGKCVNII